MSKYLELLYKKVDAGGFCRLFKTECKDCGKELFSVGEDIDVETGTIKARFICDCGAKYKKIVYSRGTGKSYKCQQGLVIDDLYKGKKRRLINTLNYLYLVTPEGIKRKPKRKIKDNSSELED